MVTVDFLRDLFTTLRTMADYVIVDTPPGFTAEVIAAIQELMTSHGKPGMLARLAYSKVFSKLPGSLLGDHSFE